MGRSNAVPLFRTSPGARLTVTLSLGISKPAELIAHRTRERASSMEGSLVPMTSMPGMPPERLTSDGDGKGLHAPERG